MTRETKYLVGGIGIGVVLGVLLSAVALMGTGWYLQGRMARQGQQGVKALQGSRAADIELTDINPASPTHGQRVRLSETWKGRGLLLNFIASWCGPCRTELPDLQAIHAAGEAPLVCLASSEMGDEGEEALVNLAKATGLTAPLLYAKGAVVEKIDAAYTHSALPTTYVIDREGVIRDVRPGARPAAAFRRSIAANL